MEHHFNTIIDEFTKQTLNMFNIKSKRMVLGHDKKEKLGCFIFSIKKLYLIKAQKVF